MPKKAKKKDKDEDDKLPYEIKIAVPKPSYGSNAIHMNKYTWYNFFPKNMYKQLTQSLNFYFLMLAILQVIPLFSVTNNYPTLLIPLIFFMILTGIKDFLEDYQNTKIDNKINNEKTKYLKGGNQKDIRWQDLKCGQIVYLKQDQKVPADMILLQSANMKSRSCYVETENLDGEKNLKKKEMIVIEEALDEQNSQDYVNYFINSKICYNTEDPDYNNFTGRIELVDQTIKLSERNLLLRGTVIANTPYVYGVVVYVGRKTKIMLQKSSKQIYKSSELELFARRITRSSMIMQLILCLFASIYHCSYILVNKSRYEQYFEISFFSIIVTFFQRLVNWMLVMSAFVPISLTFTLEMVKYFQGWRLSKIQIMKTFKTNNAGQVLADEIIMPKANNPSLNEELGQVFHIFTDKTGTLTSNLMTFNRLLLGRYEFCKKIELNEDDDEDDIEIDEIDKAFQGILQEESPDGEKCRFALRCLALNNNVNYQEDNTPTSKSPEELEFVNFCKKYNYNYQAPDQQKGDTFDSDKLTYILEEENSEQLYEHLDKIEFTSDRKMMSTIVRMCPRSKQAKYGGMNKATQDNIDLQDKEHGDIYIFVKGADDVIADKLDLGRSPDLHVIKKNIDKLSRKGLRIFMIAYKKIDEADWKQWKAEYEELKLSNDKEKQKELEDQLESDLVLIGAAALEDRLQQDVKETMKFLHAQKLKIWMVTGDKKETVKRVGQSSGIINEYAKFFEFSDPKKITESELKKIRKDFRNKKQYETICSIVTGSYFNVIWEYRLTNINLYEKFVKLLMKSKSVIFSRMQHNMKANVVKMVQTYNRKIITLAIGDGANDINMLAQSNVGVGIAQDQDAQISRNADFVIGEFRHLKPLLCVYGRECYRKNSYVIFFEITKNIFLALPPFWYGFWSYFTPNPFYDKLLEQFYHVLFTFLPIILFGVFDKEYSKVKLLFSPLLYQTGRDRFYFSAKNAVKWYAQTMMYTLLITLLSLSCFDWGNYQNGQSFGFFVFAHMCYFGIVVLANIKVFLISRSISFLFVCVIIMKQILFIAGWYILDKFEFSYIYQTFNRITGSPQFYIYLIGIIAIGLLDSLIANIDFLRKEIKYVPDFEVKYDAKVEVNTVNKEKFDLALEGVFLNEKNEFYDQTQKQDEFENIDDDESEFYSDD